MPIPSRLQNRASRLIKLCHLVIARHVPGTVAFSPAQNLPTQPASLIHLQQINRNMRRGQFHQRIQWLPPTLPLLLRQPRNQIKTEIRNSRRTQNRRRPVNIRPPMYPPRRLQLLIAKRLDAKTNPINPRRHPSRRLLCRHRLRIRLQCNFCQVRNKVIANRIHNPPQMPRIQQTRRPSANVNRIHHCIRNPRRQTHARRRIELPMPRHLLADALHIRREPRRRHHPRMEVAISALRLTKRHLHINPKSVHNSQNSSTPSSVGAQHCCAPVCRGAKISRLPLTQLFSPSTFTKIFLSRGPSNSQRKIPCHRPNSNFPSSTKITWLVPTITAFACESVFPSLCR